MAKNIQELVFKLNIISHFFYGNPFSSKWILLFKPSPKCYAHHHWYLRDCMLTFKNTLLLLCTLHSISFYRDTVVGTPLEMVEKREDNGLFGGKIKVHNTLLLASLWIFMLWSHKILSEKIGARYWSKTWKN